MAKKHPTRSGWPRGGNLSTVEAKFDAIRRLADKFPGGSFPEAEFSRYMLRLESMLREWPEFAHVRFDAMELQSALHTLPAEEFDALLHPDSSPRRSQKARAELIQQAFDPALAELASAALGNSVGRAGSPDDIGALAVGLFAIRTIADGSAPIGGNILLNQVLNVSLAELFELGQAKREIDDATAPKEGETPPDEATLRARRLAAMEKHPAFQRDSGRRAFMVSHRLLSYLDRGIIRTSLPPDKLGPLFLEAMKHAQTAPAGTEAQADAKATEGQTASEPAAAGHLRAFAADPANEEMFRKFADDLAAEAQEATEKGHPLAPRLTRLADLVRQVSGASSQVRFIIAQGCLSRVARQVAAALDKEGASRPSPAAEPQASEEAPPA